MKNRIYGLLAETPIHPGSGQDGGLIDKPVAREAATDYPVIVGSAFKGALRDTIFLKNYHEPKLADLDEEAVDDAKKNAREIADRAANKIFGTSENAGGILVSDVRLLLLPVRSLNASYFWVTCPHLLERLERDLSRCGTPKSFKIDKPNKNQYVGSHAGPIYLEERRFAQDTKTSLDAELLNTISSFIPHGATRQRVPSQLVVLNDTDFSWFARYGLSVSARNSLDRETKSSLNLWYEETIPCDALFYSVLFERDTGALASFHDEFIQSGYVRVGGNETVGQGWFAVQNFNTSPKASNE